MPLVEEMAKLVGDCVALPTPYAHDDAVLAPSGDRFDDLVEQRQQVDKRAPETVRPARQVIPEQAGRPARGPDHA